MYHCSATTPIEDRDVGPLSRYGEEGSLRNADDAEPSVREEHDEMLFVDVDEDERQGHGAQMRICTDLGAGEKSSTRPALPARMERVER